MKHLCTLFFLLFTVPFCAAQQPTDAPEVSIFIEDSLWAMTPATTLSELRRGWDIQGYTVGRRLTRYLWGRQSNQNAFGSCPAFVIRPAKDATLTDYVLIRLRRKKDFRRFESATLMECSYQRAEPQNFQITAYGEDAFRVQPHESLDTGEYVWVCLTQKPTNEYGDVKVYDFSVR